jgi:hypothetical protein
MNVVNTDCSYEKRGANAVDILLGVNAGESHGTVPLSWECQVQVYRLPSSHTVRIGLQAELVTDSLL